jgi:hypothetical protein
VKVTLSRDVSQIHYNETGIKHKTLSFHPKKYWELLLYFYKFHTFNSCFVQWVGVAVTLFPRIQEVLGLKLGHTSVIPAEVFTVFLTPSMQILG